MQCSGRPNEVDDQIKAIIESDRHVTVREIEEMLKRLKLTVIYSISFWNELSMVMENGLFTNQTINSDPYPSELAER